MYFKCCSHAKVYYDYLFKLTKCSEILRRRIDFNINSPHIENWLIDCGFHHIEVHYDYMPFIGAKNTVKKDILGQYVFILNEPLSVVVFLDVLLTTTLIYKFILYYESVIVLDFV